MAIGLCAAEFIAVLVWRAGSDVHRRRAAATLASAARTAARLDIPALTVLMLVLAAAYGLRVARTW